MPSLAFCGECGQKLLEGKPFCGNCGHNNAGGAATTPAKSGGGGGSVGGKFCGGCKRSLEGVLRYTTALDKEWHLECFVCAKCKADFNGGKFFVQDGSPICESCTQNTGPQCAGCNKPCGEKYIGALDKKWHHGCFVCGGCSKSLAGGVGFITRGDSKPYCDSVCANRSGGGGASPASAAPAVVSRPATQVSSSNFAPKSQANSSTCSACSRNAGKAFCPECGKKLGGGITSAPALALAPNNNNAQREREQREREQQQQREKEQQQRQREQQQREQQQREQQQREQQQREQQQREQQQREQQQREQQQREQREQQQKEQREQQQRQQQKPQASPAAKSYFCGECGTKMAAPSFCPECGHNNGPAVAPSNTSRPAVAASKPYQAPAALSAPSAPPDAPGAPPDAPGAPPMAPDAPPSAPSGYSSFAAPGGKALPAGRGDLLAQINAGKKLKKAPKPVERGVDGLPVGSESGGGGGGAKKSAGGAAGGGRGGPMDMQAQLAAKLASRNK